MIMNDFLRALSGLDGSSFRQSHSTLTHIARSSGVTFFQARTQSYATPSRVILYSPNNTKADGRLFVGAKVSTVRLVSREDVRSKVSLPSTPAQLPQSNWPSLAAAICSSAQRAFRLEQYLYPEVPTTVISKIAVTAITSIRFTPEARLRRPALRIQISLLLEITSVFIISLALII